MMPEPFIEVIPDETLQRRVAEMGAQISADYPQGDLVVAHEVTAFDGLGERIGQTRPGIDSRRQGLEVVP